MQPERYHHRFRSASGLACLQSDAGLLYSRWAAASWSQQGKEWAPRLVGARSMSAFVVIGGQWGDEGKGRMVDLLAQDAAIIARYSAGDNAGHTITVHTEAGFVVATAVDREGERFIARGPDEYEAVCALARLVGVELEDG